MASVNIALECYSIVVSLLIILHLLASENRKEKLNRLFLWMLLSNVAVLACDLTTWFLDGITVPWVRPVILTANFGVYSFGYVIVAVFTDYLVTYLGMKGKISRRFIQVVAVLCVLAIGLVLLSQFNHMYYYFDERNQYHRNDWYWFSQAFPIGMIVADSVVVIRHRKDLNRREFLSLLSYEILPVTAMAIQIFLFGITLLYLSTTLSMLVIYVSVQMEHSLRLKEQDIELQDSRVSIMLSQIQPHFLYNSLTTIRYLCKEDPDAAQEAVGQFSAYLRNNMDSLTLKRPIPFDQELEHVKNYPSLEERRFGERLNVVYDVTAHEFLLPALSLQPLVENAVRYGIMKKKKGGTLWISTEETEREWHVTISDDGAGFEPDASLDDGRSHVGIENVSHRLKAMCGGSLEITSKPGEGTRAVIILPRINELGRAPC